VTNSNSEQSDLGFKVVINKIYKQTVLLGVK